MQMDEFFFFFKTVNWNWIYESEKINPKLIWADFFFFLLLKKQIESKNETKN